MAGDSSSAWRKTCPSAILSIKNATQSELVLTPGLPAEKLTANHQNYGTAFFLFT
jgi:hypothetical protein